MLLTPLLRSRRHSTQRQAPAAVQHWRSRDPGQDGATATTTRLQNGDSGNIPSCVLQTHFLITSHQLFNQGIAAPCETPSGACYFCATASINQTHNLIRE